MGSIASNTITLRSGSGSLSISNGSLTNSSGETMELVDIGTINADFDLEGDEDQATNVLFNLGQFEFSAFDRLSGGSSLFEKLDTLSATDIVIIDLTFTTDGGQSVNDRYYFTIEEMEYETEERITTIKNAKQLTDDLQKSVTSFFNNDVAAGDIETFTATTPDSDCINSKDFIETALPLFNANNTTVNKSNLYSTSTAGGTTLMIVVKSDAADVDETLFELAASEGSIIGTLMGYNFMTTRTFSSGSNVSLSEDDVENLTIKAGLDSYVGIDVDFEGTSINWTNFESHSRVATLSEDVSIAETTIDVSSIANISAGDFVLVNKEVMYVESTTSGAPDTMTVKRGYRSTVTTHSNGDNIVGVFNPDGTQTLSVRFTNSLLAWAQFNGATSEFDNVGGDITSPTREALGGYASAYGANKARKVELTVFDVDTLKPYETFTFDSSFDSLLQNQTFRPSSLEYDLVKDIIKISGYKI